MSTRSKLNVGLKGVDMSRPTFLTVCPRCGTRAFENLSNHSHCLECLYFEDRYYNSDMALITALKADEVLNLLDRNKNKRKKTNHTRSISENLSGSVGSINSLTIQFQNSSKEAS